MSREVHPQENLQPALLLRVDQELPAIRSRSAGECDLKVVQTVRGVQQLPGGVLDRLFEGQLLPQPVRLLLHP